MPNNKHDEVKQMALAGMGKLYCPLLSHLQTTTQTFISPRMMRTPAALETYWPPDKVFLRHLYRTTGMLLSCLTILERLTKYVPAFIIQNWSWAKVGQVTAPHSHQQGNQILCPFLQIMIML